MQGTHGTTTAATEALDALPGILDEARELAALRLSLRPGDPGPPGLDWLSTDNLAGMRVERDGDGWHCELDLKGLGAWQPDCIGSTEPLADREAALAYGRSLVADVVLACALRRRMPPAPWPLVRDPDTFSLDGLSIPLQPATIIALRRCEIAKAGEDYATRRLSEIRATAFEGRTPTRATLQGLSPLARQAVEQVCGIAALKGMTRWPDLQVFASTLDDEPLGIPPRLRRAG